MFHVKGFECQFEKPETCRTQLCAVSDHKLSMQVDLQKITAYINQESLIVKGKCISSAVLTNAVTLHKRILK